jgi:hypothetical protein
MPRKITNSGLLADRPLAVSVPNTYYYATDEGAYYSSDGENWVEREVDVNDLSPETDAILVCGISSTGSIDPVQLNPDGSLQARPGAGVVADRSGIVATGHVSQKVADANTARKFLYLLNTSNADMYVGIGFTPTVGYGMLLAKDGGSITFDSFIPSQQINIVSDGSAKAFTALEG